MLNVYGRMDAGQIMLRKGHLSPRLGLAKNLLRAGRSSAQLTVKQN